LLGKEIKCCNKSINLLRILKNIYMEYLLFKKPISVIFHRCCEKVLLLIGKFKGNVKSSQDNH